jgi:hypothetical protein
VLVVTPQDIDLLNMSEGQVKSTAGLELLSRMEGVISTTIITCNTFTYKVAQQTIEGSGDKYRIMDAEFQKTIPAFIIIDGVLSALEGTSFDHESFFEFVTSLFGMLAPIDRSVLYMPSVRTKGYLDRLARLFPEQPNEEICKLAIFGVQSRLSLGMVAGAQAAYHEQKKVDKTAVYMKVSKDIIEKGFVGDAPHAVVLPTDGVMILADSSSFTHPCEFISNKKTTTFPASMDKNGNIGLTLYGPHQLVDTGSAQAMRQKFRARIGISGFQNAQSCTEAIVCGQLMMQQMLLTGFPRNHVGMEILRMMAQAAWQMTISSLTDKEVVHIIWEIIFKGDLPMKKEGTLMDILAKQSYIPLHPSLNWALLMALLSNDAYQAQKPHFEATLNELSIKADTADELLTWFITTFSPYTEGRISFVDVRAKECMITSQPLVGTCKRALPHGACTTQECLSLEGFRTISESPRYGPHYCPFCNSRDESCNWVDEVIPDPNVALSQAMASKIPFRIKLAGITLPCMSEPGRDVDGRWNQFGGADQSVVPPAPHAVGGGAVPPPRPSGPPPRPSSGLTKNVIIMNGQPSSEKASARVNFEEQLKHHGSVIVLCEHEEVAKGLKKGKFSGFTQQKVGPAKKQAETDGKHFFVIIDKDDSDALTGQYGIRWSDYIQIIYNEDSWSDPAKFIRANNLA